ncbi:MAG: GC-type dockerin domain-anchored protein [Planctomycetota bacterium]
MRIASMLAAGAIAGGSVLADEQVFYGDADGFGFGAPEVDGALWRDGLGGVFFTDYRDAGDIASAPMTDWWDAFGTQTWTFDYDPSGIDSANLHFYAAGYGDFTGPAEVFVEGTLLATLDFAGQFQTTHIIDLDVPTGLLDGSTSVEFRTPDGDGYIVDYARLDLIGDDCRVDLDGDGELTIFDFLEFQNLFDAGDPAADFDGDGSLTIFDFLEFQNEFDVGCG